MTLRAYRFGEFRLDAAKRELTRGDRAVPLQLKVFDCLAYLIEHRDRAVGRDELIAAVWGKVDVTDNVLGQIVGRARHAVDDTGEEQRAIRTVLRFGYRWVLPVEPVEPAEQGALPAAKSTSVIASPPRAFARSRAWPLALIAALAIGAGAWAFAQLRDAAAPARPHDSTALVLPVDVDADASFAWVRLGMMDLIAQRLRTAGQAVVPSDSTVALVRKLDPKHPRVDVAKAAMASLVVETRAALVDGRWRVSLRTTYGRNPPLGAEAESGDVLDAARTAADRLAASLGFAPVREAAPVPREQALVQLVQRAKAAILANHLDDARALLDSADAEQQARPEVRYQRAQIELNAGRFEAARAALESLAAEVSAADDPVLRGQILYGLGLAIFRRSDEATAVRHLSEAVDLLEGRNDAQSRDVLGRVLNIRGAAHMFLREFDAAQTDFSRARVALESAGDPVALASLDNNSGVLMTEQDRLAEALPFFERAADRAATFDVPTELRARINIATLHLSLLDPAAALAGDAHLAELRDQVADPRLRQFADLARVQVLSANGRLREGDALLDAVRAAAPGVGDEPQAAFAEALAARIALRNANYDTAARVAEAALNARWDSDSPEDYALAWLTRVRAELGRGRIDAAVRAAAAARGWADRNGTPEARLYAALAEAESTAPADAKPAFERALAAAEAKRVPADLLRVAEAYSAHLVRMKDLAAASRVAGRVAGWAAQDYDAALLELRLYHAIGNATAWQSALSRARALAGERVLPVELVVAPATEPPTLADRVP